MLIASSATQEGIRQLAERYYCGCKLVILEDGTIQRQSDGQTLGCRVIRKGKRYRLELPENA